MHQPAALDGAAGVQGLLQRILSTGPEVWFFRISCGAGWLRLPRARAVGGARSWHARTSCVSASSVARSAPPRGLTAITRLRLDAALYEPAPPRPPGTIGRPRKKGARLPTLFDLLADESTSWQALVVQGWYGAGERAIEITSATAVWRHGGLPVVPIRWVLVRDPRRRFDPQALLCTDQAQDPLRVVRWFVQRWQVEVTFREARDHLGVETQRQWSDRAIARTTPCLLGLFSIVTLLAARLGPQARLRVPATAWYSKKHPTFSDTLAAVRRQFWCEQGLLRSRRPPEPAKLRPALREGIAYALCHAA